VVSGKHVTQRVWNFSGLWICLYGVCGADRLNTLICRSAVPTTCEIRLHQRHCANPLVSCSTASTGATRDACQGGECCRVHVTALCSNQQQGVDECRSAHQQGVGDIHAVHALRQLLRVRWVRLPQVPVLHLHHA
jgi:hypothetical protein